MSLYHDFASHYDFIFPTDETTLSFLQHSFRLGEILDLGCATGGYALSLSTLGYAVDGIDLDERMISIAKSKAADTFLDVRFRLEDMLQLDAKDRYEGIYCIGNTLVHLPNIHSIEKMLQLMYHALRDGGTAIVQIVNYDRILDQHIEHLPAIEHAGRLFQRRYSWRDSSLLFQSKLTYESELYQGETPLLPLCSQELLNRFKAVGFEDLEWFGDFDRERFDPATSFAFVVKAKKPAAVSLDQ